MSKAHTYRLLGLFALAAGCFACLAGEVTEGPTPGTEVALASDLLRGFPAQNPDGSVNVVVEIPAGTTAKWEVESDGVLRWELRQGRPRVVDYLGYPCNYGMVPRTLMSEVAGGDGDPLDVILLGPPLERGAVVAARVIGVLELVDDGEQDDKLIAVRDGFEGVADLEDLERDYPGALAILESWFGNYKGPRRIELLGRGDRAAGLALLEAASSSFNRHQLR